MEIIKNHFLRWATLLIILLTACNQVELPDLNVYYRVKTENGNNGLAIFNGKDQKTLTGTFFLDKGNLFATAIPVTVKSNGKNALMIFPDQTESVFLFERDINPAPEYKKIPTKRLYTNPIYEVTVKTDTFARAKGFYASYPCDYDDSFVEIYLKKLLEIDPLRIKQWLLPRFLDALIPHLSDVFSIKHMKDLDLDVDIYQPVGDNNDHRPLVVFVHGGAFFNGDKGGHEFVDWCTRFASMGYVAASVNYRLGYDGTSKQVQEAGYRAVQDVRAAIRYLIAQTDLKIDKDLIFVAGTSAGAITALNVAFMEEKDIPKKAAAEGSLDDINPRYTGPIHIRAVGNMWGAVADQKIIDNQGVDIISFHNTNDNFVPYGIDIPFDILFDGKLKNLKGKMFGKMYGSQPVTVQARAHGLRAILNTYEIKESIHQQSELHSIHYNRDGQINERYRDIGDKLTDFFSEAMELHPTRLLQEGQEFRLSDTSDIQDCFWKVEGGKILDYNRYSVRVLFFPNAPSCSVTVNGTYYSTGMTFHEKSSKYEKSGFEEVKEDVDLGLSVIWAASNTGTDSSIETGDRFSREDLQDPDFFFTRMGSGWRFPTHKEIEELMINCNMETINTPVGACLMVTSKVNGRSMLLPQHREPGSGYYQYSYAYSDYGALKKFNLSSSGYDSSSIQENEVCPVRAVRER